MVWLNLCDLGTFPWLLLWWLLPFLLGLLLGWVLWAKYKALLEDCQNTLRRCQEDYSTLQSKLDECQKAREELISDNDSLRFRISTLEADCSKLREELTAASSPSSSASSTALNFQSDGGNIHSEANALYTAISDDNLEVVEGIGPAMHRLLNENGIHTWKDLANHSVESIQAMLDKHGGKYRIIDPSTWVIQASMARDGQWDKLIEFQKSLSGSTVSDTTQTDAKVEKILIKMGLLKSFKQDDLKAVEGIGPKIEALLKEAGVKTWHDLAQASVDHLRKILSDAGPRFKLADPETWPQQADLADKGEWKALQELQDFLDRGKEPGK